MKKIFFSALLICFLILPTVTQAQENLTPSPTSAPMFIEYKLAYPGMLPDNPLYKIKVLRDKISLALIADPLKKIDYLLLQADKGILATAILIDKNEISLAETTALKAENNYTLLTYELSSLFKKPDSNFFNKLKTASLKHQEVLQSLIKRLPKDKQETFKQVIDFSKRNLETVRNYQKGSY